MLGPKQTGNKNLVYWLYLAGPLAWYGVFGVRELGYAAGSDTILTAFFMSGYLAILLAPWLPTRYGPVVISAQELFYFVEGRSDSVGRSCGGPYAFASVWRRARG